MLVRLFEGAVREKPDSVRAQNSLVQARAMLAELEERKRADRERRNAGRPAPAPDDRRAHDA